MVNFRGNFRERADRRRGLSLPAKVAVTELNSVTCRFRSQSGGVIGLAVHL